MTEKLTIYRTSSAIAKMEKVLKPSLKENFGKDLRQLKWDLKDGKMYFMAEKRNNMVFVRLIEHGRSEDTG